jgi:hypothetical protein
MIFIYYDDGLSNMGCGQSSYVNKQEEFVEKKINQIRSNLPKNKYTDSQIRGKLRQEYSYNLSNSTSKSNQYVLYDDWRKVY